MIEQDINVNITISAETANAFADYLETFYGAGQLYDLGVTREEIESAAVRYIRKYAPTFEGDSIDRERTRDQFLLKECV